MQASKLGQMVARHDNDIAAIYDIVARLEKGQKKLQRKVGRIDRRLTRVDGRLDGVDGRLGGIETQLATVIDLVSRGRS